MAKSPRAAASRARRGFDVLLEPLEALVEAVAGGRAAGLDVPGLAAERAAGEVERLGERGDGGRVREVLLVRVDEDGRVAELEPAGRPSFSLGNKKKRGRGGADCSSKLWSSALAIGKRSVSLLSTTKMTPCVSE